MSKMRKSRGVRSAASLIVACMISISGGSISIANTSFDVNGSQLSFDNAKEKRGSNALGSLITQTDADSNTSLDIGEDFAVGDYADYFNVITIGGQALDARITIMGEVGIEGNSTDGLVDKLDDADGTPGENKFVNLDLDFNQQSGESYVELKIEFFKNLSSTPEAVTLQNVRLSVYDIDLYQFLEVTSFNRYFLSTDTVLTVSEVRGGISRISENAGAETNSGGTPDETQTKTRVTLEFDAVSTITFRLGQTPPGSAPQSNASFSLDFSQGATWSNLQAAAVTNPVLSAPAPRSVPYEGPLNLRNQSGTLCSGGEGVLTGERLNTITEIYVGDKKVAQELLPDGRLKYSLKDIAPGTYQIRYWVPVNSVNLTDQIRVGTCSTAPVATTPGAFEASRLFANYRGDRGPVIARDRAAITAFINQYKGITSVKCVGSTSGVPAKRTDPALATARAKNACDIVKTLVPNATFTLETSTGKGVGQRFRSVTIFISGTN